MAVPDYDVLRAVREASKNSELVQALQKGRDLYALLDATPAQLLKAGYKQLNPTQRRKLKNQGNTAQDWKKIWVDSQFDPDQVWRCHFIGPNLLSACKGEVSLEGVSFPRGLSHATLSHSVIGPNVLIRNVRLVHQTLIQEEAVLFDVGAVTKGKSDSFANGVELLLAVETGGREVTLYSDLTVEGAWVLTRSRAEKGLLSSYAREMELYLQNVSAPFNVIGPSAQILHTPRVRDLFLGDFGLIDSATKVENVTVLSNAEEVTEISHGAIVQSSILQWGCEVTSGAIVDSSLMTEHSHVERHGKVTHSVLGPNTGVAEGEVTSALLGPFVGFHHQALLIAALWPEGKGNVGYGANIGSNHTAKAPDQEIWPGEGLFFGLGVNIKFPSDFTQSPYTIIASGVSMLPQKIQFPFSLINTPAALYPGISPAYNEIMPAWVLSDNIYMVKRNEGKYQKRNKARRSKFDFEVFRPEIVEMMVEAREQLSAASGKEIYTAKQVKGLGKNYMSEISRLKAIETYTTYLRYYALMGLKRELADRVSSGRREEIEGLLEQVSESPRWEHERKILISEYPGEQLKELLENLVQMQEAIAEQVQVSKEKDDHRGTQVIEDYVDAHPPASEDAFVQETRKVTAALKNEVKQLILAVPTTASLNGITSGTV